MNAECTKRQPAAQSSHIGGENARPAAIFVYFWPLVCRRWVSSSCAADLHHHPWVTTGERTKPLLTQRGASCYTLESRVTAIFEFEWSMVTIGDRIYWICVQTAEPGTDRNAARRARRRREARNKPPINRPSRARDAHLPPPAPRARPRPYRRAPPPPLSSAPREPAWPPPDRGPSRTGDGSRVRHAFKFNKILIKPYEDRETGGLKTTDVSRSEPVAVSRPQPG